MNKKIAIILAIGSNGVIGDNREGKNPIPWLGSLKSDMTFFRKTTIGGGNNAVAMGRVTKETIEEQYFPLVKRKNVILTTNRHYELPAEVDTVHSVEELMNYHATQDHDTLWIAGGLRLYRDMFPKHEVTEAYITRVHDNFTGDVHFNELNELLQNGWKKESEEHHDADDKNAYAFTWEKWVRA